MDRDHALAHPPIAEPLSAENGREAAAAIPYVRRFDGFARVLHLFLMISFLGLAGTGLPLLYAHTGWAWWLARFWGGYETAGLLHRAFAAILIAVFVSHLARVAYRTVWKREWKTMLWGPTSMVPQPRDVKEMVLHVRWFLGRGPKPVFDRYTYWEKFDYLAVFWGVFIIGGSGLLLWFPTFFARFIPGWLFNIADVVHGEEALLAMGFIFTVHFFNGHLRAGKYPMDDVIFTGRMPRRLLEEERPAEHQRLVASGRLEALDAPSPSAELVFVSRVVGLAAVGIGLAIVLVIVYSALR